MKARLFLFVVGLLAALSVALPTSPLDTVEVNFADSGLIGWQACAIFPASGSGGYPVTELLSRCNGPYLGYGCVQSGIPNTLIQFAGSNSSVVFNNGTVNGTLQFFSDTGVGRLGYSNGTSPPANCLVASGTGICRNVDDGVIAPGMYCGPTIGYTLSTSVALIVFSNPCGGSAVAGDPCYTDAGLCSVNNTCFANSTCGGGVALTPPALAPCIESWQCSPPYGNFSATYRLTNASCVSDTNLCAIASQCDSLHQCIAIQNQTCPSFDPCKLDGVCNITTGACSFPYNAPDNITSCFDNDICTSNERCLGGVCIGTLSPPENRTCQIPDTCDPLTGVWSYNNTFAGAPCVPNSVCIGSNLLGSNFQCDGLGSCVSTATTNCSTLPIPTCRTSGICNATSATCETPFAPQFMTCDDLNPCTQGTTCGSDGTCGSGFPAIGCGSPGIACQVLTPTAFNSTLCVCTLANAADNTTCSVENAPCVLNTKCLSGACVGTARTCPGDDCNGPTACSNVTGCSSPINAGGFCNRTCFAGSVCNDVGSCVGGTRTNNVVGCAIGAAMQFLDTWIFGEALAA